MEMSNEKWLTGADYPLKQHLFRLSVVCDLQEDIVTYSWKDSIKAPTSHVRRPGNLLRNAVKTASSALTEKMFTGEKPRRQAR